MNRSANGHETPELKVSSVHFGWIELVSTDVGQHRGLDRRVECPVNRVRPEIVLYF